MITAGHGPSPDGAGRLASGAPSGGGGVTSRWVIAASSVWTDRCCQPSRGWGGIEGQPVVERPAGDPVDGEPVPLRRLVPPPGDGLAGEVAPPQGADATVADHADVTGQLRLVAL